jgi:hypothetical protein
MRYLDEFPNGQWAIKAQRRIQNLGNGDQSSNTNQKHINVIPVNYRGTAFPEVRKVVARVLRSGIRGARVETNNSAANIKVATEIKSLEISQSASGAAIGLTLGAALLGQQQGADVSNILNSGIQNKFVATVKMTATNRKTGKSLTASSSHKLKTASNVDRRIGVEQVINIATENATSNLVALINQHW